MSNLRMYMVWEGDDPSYGAVLVFARTAREARNLGHGSAAVFGMGDYLLTRARWLRDDEYGYLRECATEEGPHVVDDVPSCADCYMWGVGRIGGDGRCATCRNGGVEFASEDAETPEPAEGRSRRRPGEGARGGPGCLSL